MEFGLIGEKLGHSYSKIIHESLGAYEYTLCPLAPAELNSFVSQRNFSGLNVTIPYKTSVIPLCDIVDPLAEEIGAVNTLHFDESHRLHGSNTDYHGFLYAMEYGHITIKNKSALILGDGGTSKTVYTALKHSGASDILVATRHVPPTSHSQEKHFISYDSLPLHKNIELVINTTPVGMYPHVNASPCDLSIFPNCTGVFDVIYNPSPTLLLSQAQSLDIPSAGGLMMLVAQATKAAELFLGNGYDFQSRNQAIAEMLLEKL